MHTDPVGDMDPRPLLLHGFDAVDAESRQQDAWLLARGGRIEARGTGDGWRGHAAGVAPDRTIEGRGRILVPGFVDLHRHGGGAASHEDGAEAVARAFALHLAHGTTRGVVSFVAAPIDDLAAGLRMVASLATSNPLLLGSHLEGPFLAASRRGVHGRAHLLDPDPAVVRRFLDAADGTLRQVTIAPELPGAIAAVRTFVEAGVTVAVGHTDADYAQARAAFDAGATLLTHTFNAMPGLGHRAPGPIAAAIDDDRVRLELILDGHHVHPSIASILFRAAPHRVALVTDAMAGAGAGDGTFRLGDAVVEVTDGLVTVAGTATLGGSTLTLDTALRAAIRLGVEPTQAVEAVTSTPAAALGLDARLGMLQPGYAADLVVLDDGWHITAVFAAGRQVVAVR